MQTITNQAEAIAMIAEIQAVILEKARAWTSFKFEFTINHETRQIVLCGRYGFDLYNNKTDKELSFTGKTIEEAANKFLVFFQNGGVAKVTQRENERQFKAIFSYNHGWVVKEAQVGSYLNRDDNCE